MNILFVANINSPIARNWISYFVECGDQVSLVSQYPLHAKPLEGVTVYYNKLLFSHATALSNSAHMLHSSGNGGESQIRRLVRTTLRSVILGSGLRSIWSGYIAPVDTIRLRRKMQQLVESIKPDIVHGLRLPMEGESLAGLSGFPLALSIWGNDLTLYASNYWAHRVTIRKALSRAQGLHADCQRDVQLAYEYGYPSDGITLVVPGAGGIRQSLLATPEQIQEWRQRLNISEGIPVVLNPRGVRSYIRTKEYFQAIPQVLRVHPDAVFVSVAVTSDSAIPHLVESLGISQSVRLLPSVSQSDLAALFKLCTIMVSPSIHDGTPNTLLEGMANGAVPLAGDLESVREWIKPGENGLLFDSRQPTEIATAIIQALGQPDWLIRARARNQLIIKQRADYVTCMGQARVFYQQIIDQWSRVSRLNS